MRVSGIQDSTNQGLRGLGMWNLRGLKDTTHYGPCDFFEGVGAIVAIFVVQARVLLCGLEFGALGISGHAGIWRLCEGSIREQCVGLGFPEQTPHLKTPAACTLNLQRY